MPWDFWLIFFVLGVLVPWRGHVRLCQLLAKPHVDSRERIALYLSTIAFQWLATAVVGWRAWARGLTAADLGLVIPSATNMAYGVAGGLGLAVLQWLNLRRVGRMAKGARGQMQALAERILPRGPAETACFLVLAFTAGACEEFLYRGFTVAALFRVLPLWLVVLASAVLFGLAHLYQGKGGLVSTTLLGLIFGAARVFWLGLAPLMIWHICVDFAAGLAGPKYLLRGVSPAVHTPEADGA